MAVRIQGYVLCGLAMITVGSTVVVSKLIAAEIPPFTATALRFMIAFPILAGLMVLTDARWPRPSFRDGPLLILQASLGSVGYTVLLLSGMGLASAVDAGAITGTLPVVAGAIAIVVLRERVEATMLVSMLLALGGILAVNLVSAGSATGFSAAALLGNALVLGAVTCEALFLLLNKKLRTPLAPLPMATSMTGIGLVLAAPAALLEEPWAVSLDSSAFAGIAYYALVPTVGGFLLWYAGSMKLSGTEASLLTVLAPLSAVGLAALLLEEAVGPVEVIGIGLILGAVLLPLASTVGTGTDTAET